MNKHDFFFVITLTFVILFHNPDIFIFLQISLNIYYIQVKDALEYDEAFESQVCCLRIWSMSYRVKLRVHTNKLKTEKKNEKVDSLPSLL